MHWVTFIAMWICCDGQYGPIHRQQVKMSDSVHVVPHGPQGAVRPFVYNHVAKTGGSFVKNVLVAMLGRESITILEEWHGMGLVHEALPSTGKNRPFVMGAIRAPCDYYVSLWAFSSGDVKDRVVGSDPSLRQFQGRDAAHGFHTPGDITRFQKWVSNLASETLNLLTSRFWFSYFKRGNPCKPKMQKCVGMESGFEAMREEIDRDLANATLDDLADCWIRTDNLETDLETCLRKYETEAGISLDWDLFKQIRDEQRKKKNSSGRNGTCSDFADASTVDLIERKDRHVVRMFGYSGCCAGSEGSEKEEL